MCTSLSEEDVKTIRDALRKISGSAGGSVSVGASLSWATASNPVLNGLNKPPKGTKIFNRRHFESRKHHEKKQEERKALIKLGNPALQHKMMRLAKLNLLGAHASTEGPLGYANKPVSAITSPQEGFAQIDSLCKSGVGSEWNRIDRAPDDLIRSALDANYLKVRANANITSEGRIKQLISSLRLLLIELNVPSDEFLAFFEENLNRLIEDKSWIAITPSTALFMAVSSEENKANSATREGGTNNNSRDGDVAWFTCNKCKFCYPPQKFPCVVCGSTFRSISDLFAHNLENHAKLVFESFQCEICCKDFGNNPIALRSHCNLDHFCRFKHLECPYGCKTLIPEENEGTLNQHLYAEHLCRICGDVFEKDSIQHQKQFHSVTSTSSNHVVEALKGGVSVNSVSKSYTSQVHSKHRTNSRHVDVASRYPSSSRSKEKRRSRGVGRSRSRSLSRRGHGDYTRARSSRSRSRNRNRSKRSRTGDGSRCHRRLDGSRSKSRHRADTGLEDCDNRGGRTCSIEIPISSPNMYSPLSSENEGEGLSMPAQVVFRAPHFMSSERIEWLTCADCALKVPPPGTYDCHMCSADFEIASSLYHHVQTEHGLRVPKTFDCEFCSEVFSKAAQWDDHVYAVHLCGYHKQSSKQSQQKTTGGGIGPNRSSVDRAFLQVDHYLRGDVSAANVNVNLTYCTECEYSCWRGQMASEPRRGVLLSRHAKCPEPQCPLLFHSHTAAQKHFEMDKRCARLRLDDNLMTKHCVACVLSMRPVRVLCSYCPPELCEYTNEHELLDHLLSTHFSEARMSLLPMLSCDLCRKGFDDAQFQIYMAHLAREHKLCSALHKFCDDSLECCFLYPRDWKEECKHCSNQIPQATAPATNTSNSFRSAPIQIASSSRGASLRSTAAVPDNDPGPLSSDGYMLLSSALSLFNR